MVAHFPVGQHCSVYLAIFLDTAVHRVNRPFQDSGDTSEKIPVEPGFKLYQVFEGPSFAPLSLFAFLSNTAFSLSFSATMSQHAYFLTATDSVDTWLVNHVRSVGQSKTSLHGRKDTQAGLKCAGAVGKALFEHPCSHFNFF